MIAPWENIARDLFGPRKIEDNHRQIDFNALTCIYTATNEVELIQIKK